jgi:hypothetical protein
MNIHQLLSKFDFSCWSGLDRQGFLTNYNRTRTTREQMGGEENATTTKSFYRNTLL